MSRVGTRSGNVPIAPIWHSSDNPVHVTRVVQSTAMVKFAWSINNDRRLITNLRATVTSQLAGKETNQSHTVSAAPAAASSHVRTGEVPVQTLETMDSWMNFAMDLLYTMDLRKPYSLHSGAANVQAPHKSPHHTHNAGNHTMLTQSGRLSPQRISDASHHVHIDPHVAASRACRGVVRPSGRPQPVHAEDSSLSAASAARRYSLSRWSSQRP